MISVLMGDMSFIENVSLSAFPVIGRNCFYKAAGAPMKLLRFPKRLVWGNQAAKSGPPSSGKPQGVHGSQILRHSPCHQRDYPKRQSR